MTDREALDRAVSGNGPAAFTALAWERLPEFLNSRAPEQWWLDPSFCVRVLNEFAALCRLDCVQVPAVRGSLSPRSSVAEAESDAAIECIAQLTKIGRTATMAVVPAVDILQALVPDALDEDVEDDLCDLVSELLNAGADAICVRGDDASILGETLEGLDRIVRHFGRVLVGVSHEAAVSATAGLVVTAVQTGDPWPSTGLAIATRDLSIASPIDLQEWIQARA